MSLNFNGPSFVPMIQESQSMKNNGGGGNTGYFQRRNKKKENKEIEVFKDADDIDEFIQTKQEEIETPQKEGILSKIVEKTKDFIKPSINKPSNPFQPMED